MSRRLFSVCIPTYEMGGLGSAFLRQSFEILADQTFQDFDVVISDHSTTDSIRDLCAEFEKTLRLKYFRNLNKIGNSSANTNNAIGKATGWLIKLLFQDDFLFGSRALELTAAAFDVGRESWLVSASEHTTDNGITLCFPLYPRYHSGIHLGDNTISSPSVLTISNVRPLLFDENLVLRMDCDYYERCHGAFGEPQILDEITVVNRIGSHQLSATMNSESLKEQEYAYLLLKYREPNARLLLFRYKAKRRLNRVRAAIKRALLGEERRSITTPHPEKP